MYVPRLDHLGWHAEEDLQMSFYVTYALKTSPEHHKAYGDQLMTCIVRLMQDVPMNTNVSRKVRKSLSLGNALF
jgi:hypothetical protein